MKIKEMAEKLGLATRVVRRFIRSGKIHAKKDEKGRWILEGTLPEKDTLKVRTRTTKKSSEGQASEAGSPDKGTAE